MITIPQAIIDKTFNENGVLREYQKLKETITSIFDERVWFMTEAALSVCVSCLLDDIANPVALIFVDGPSTEKTTVLDFLDGLPYCHRVDKFTPASFLTQSGNVQKKNLKNVDLLAKIPYKTVLIPEMAPLFNQQKEILQDNYGMLARILDGTGMTNAGAVHGQRSLTGDYIFGLLGATTPISQTAWNAMGKVGSRLLFLNAPSRQSRADRLSRAKSILTNQMHYKQKKRLAKNAVAEYLLYFFERHRTQDYQPPEEAPEGLDSAEALRDHCGYLPRSVKWDATDYCEETMEAVALLADFVTTARQDTRVWTERGDDGHMETNSTGTVTEGVERFTALIHNLARSHALLSGRTRVTSEELPLVIAVSLSCLPDDRRKAVELLIDPSIPFKETSTGQFTLSELENWTKVSDKSAKKNMKKLELLGLGEVENGMGPNVTRFRLNSDFDWLLTDDFLKHHRPWDKKKDAGETVCIPF